MQDAMGEQTAAAPMQAGAAIQDGAQMQAGSPIHANAQIQVVRPSLGETLPAPHAVAGAIITGSWNMVTDREDWSELTAAWVREAFAGDVPLLGICYGHQLMAHALGGVVDYHPQG
ncbi:MAG: glutamine amidotransferase, partial [Comamonadaceae bacterium]